MSKRQYLDLMGIDVWQKRQPRAVVDNAVVEESSQPVASQMPGESGRTALLADVKRSLQDGSDVQAVPQVVEVVETTNTEVVAPAEPAPEFYLAFSHFSSLMMVNIYPGGFAAIPGNHQRFLTTLYFALRGEKGGSQLQEVRWPMVKSDRISQSRDDAKQVLGRHLQQCQSDILVFGEDSADLLGGQVDAVYGEIHVRDRKLSIVEETESYFRDPIKRKVLWQFLSPLKQRLRGSS